MIKILPKKTPRERIEAMGKAKKMREKLSKLDFVKIDGKKVKEDWLRIQALYE